MIDLPSDDAADTPTAGDAADVIAHTRARMVARAATPWWYPVTYGAGVGGMVASLALPVRLVPIGLAACVALLLGGYAVWQRQTGLRVNGWRPGATRAIAVRLAVTMALCLASAGLWRSRGGGALLPVILGLVLAVIAGAASAAWDRAWRAEMRGGGAP